MKPDREQIRSVVRSVWSTQLGLEIRSVHEAFSRSSMETLTAAIHIAGDFHGGIRMECSRALIRRAGAIMFSLPEGELQQEDERDVIGELTNVVAGNIKALIPGSNAVSLPTIIEGTDYQVSSVDVRSADEFHFTLDGEPMVVTLVEHRA